MFYKKVQYPLTVSGRVLLISVVDVEMVSVESCHYHKKVNSFTCKLYSIAMHAGVSHILSVDDDIKCVGCVTQSKW